jgi:beta-galactosidase
LFALIATLALGRSCATAAAIPQFGAQIWIEPGQTPEQIDGWFATLEAGHMPVARLFMMWSYLEPRPDGWDWSLYDAAFRSAERHHVAIVATLTPSGPPAWLGGNDSQGIGVNSTEQERARAAKYIAKVVERYKDSPALDTWLLLNEPGEAPVASELADAGFAPWLQGRYGDVAALNRMWGTDFASFAAVKGPTKANGWNPASGIDWTAYWRSFQTSQLAWMALEVRRHDDRHPLHLNPHALVGNIAAWSDDLPTWRGFLDTLGCSIHPAWHFGLLPRSDFALGVSYVNDLVDGAIAPKPHWVTELQGGNNISSGGRPMEPTVDDTAQWLWTSVAAGAQRTIFWLLNARRAGQEAGEWSLLDFDQHPSRRMEVATAVEKTMEAHADVFASAKPAVPDITLLVSLDSLTYQLFYAANDDPARDKDQHMLELLGFYEAMSRIGPPPRVKHFDDYDWTSPGTGRVAILPDARVLTAKQMDELLAFARSGGTLLLSGLSGLYDEHGKMWALDPAQPLSSITGARWKEVHLLGKEISVPLESGALPSRMWISSTTLVDARAIGTRDGETVATDRQFAGGGRVIWVPSPIGIGAWTGDPAPLEKFLAGALSKVYAALPFALEATDSPCLLRVMRSGAAYVTVLTNGGDTSVACSVRGSGHLQSSRIWPVSAALSGRSSVLAGRETVVDIWR